MSKQKSPEFAKHCFLLSAAAGRQRCRQKTRPTSPPIQQRNDLLWQRRFQIVGTFSHCTSRTVFIFSYIIIIIIMLLLPLHVLHLMTEYQMETVVMVVDNARHSGRSPPPPPVSHPMPQRRPAAPRPRPPRRTNTNVQHCCYHNHNHHNHLHRDDEDER